MKNATRDELDAVIATRGWHKSGHAMIEIKVDFVLSDRELEELTRLMKINAAMLLKLAVKGL